MKLVADEWKHETVCPINQTWNNKGSRQKKQNSGYNEFGIKGGRVSDLNHYFNQL